MKAGSYSRKDNKPLTLREFKAILNSIPEASLDKPVGMSCDEEGNDTDLKLMAVDISKTGDVLLWPAHV